VSINVTMPKLGMTMKTGKLSKWYKSEGDHVEEGGDLFEVETEKITNQIEAPAGGILFQIVVREGEVVPVGTIVGVIAEPGEKPERIEGIQAGEVEERKPAAAAAPKVEAEKPAQPPEILATPASKRLARELGVDIALVKGTGPDGRIRETDVTLYHEQAQRKPKITPLAEEIAKKAGLDISAISGTGEGGKITREDVERAIQATKPAAAAKAEEEVPAGTIPMTGMRRAIAEASERMNLRVKPEVKARLVRAAALRHTDLTGFVTRTALREAEAVIEEAERIKLSERDSLLVLDLLENPPPANAKLRAAIAAMPKKA